MMSLSESFTEAFLEVVVGSPNRVNKLAEDNC